MHFLIRANHDYENKETKKQKNKPHKAIQCNGNVCTFSTSLTSAPWPISRAVHSMCPYWAAKLSDVPSCCQQENKKEEEGKKEGRKDAEKKGDINETWDIKQDTKKKYEQVKIKNKKMKKMKRRILRKHRRIVEPKISIWDMTRQR